MKIETLSDANLHGWVTIALSRNLDAALTSPPPVKQATSNFAGQGPFLMPAFVKTPRFIGGAIFVLWLTYVIVANSDPRPIEIAILPFVAKLELRLSAVIIGVAAFGAVVTLVIQFLLRRSSKNGSAS